MDGITITYGKFDPSAKADSTPTTNQNQPWANINDLQYDNITVEKNVGTFEHNQITLNGEQEGMPDVPDNYSWGLWTTAASDNFGNFSEPYPTLDVSFANPHSSNGTTLYFYPFTDDYASKIRITWYDAGGAIIKSGIYENNSVIGAAGESVARYTRIKLEFMSTNIRNRFVKIYAINFGKERVFTDEEIDSCNILEEIDPTSEKLSVNTMGFRIKTHNPEFSHVTGDISEQLLMINQQMTVRNNGEPFGTFFLKTSKDVYGTGTVFEFQTNDAVGVMDAYPFMGDVYVDKPIRELIQELFDICFPTKLIDFVLDPVLENETVSGLIPAGTCRAALQYICFAKGAIADTSRRNYVWIYKLEPLIERIVTREKTYRNGTIESTEYFTGVDVVSCTYTKGAEEKTAYNDHMDAGEHTIIFTEPLHTLYISGGTILAQSATYATINVPVAGTVTLTGLNYILAKMPYRIRTDTLPGEIGRVKVYDGCTLVSQADAENVANHAFSYLSKRKRIGFNVRLEDLECGYYTKVATVGNPVLGYIESLDIKLRGRKALLALNGDVWIYGDVNNRDLRQLGQFGLGPDGGLM